MDQVIRIVVDSTGAERGTRLVNRSLNQMQKEVKETDTDLAKIRRAFNRTGKEAKGLAKDFKGAAQEAGALANKFGTLVGVTLGGAGIVAALTSVVKTGAEFEDTIQSLSAITGATGEDLEQLSDAARGLGEVTTLSASEVSRGFSLIASAKPDLLENRDALIAVTKEAITLSEAAGLELPEAARALGGALNQFNADASESGRFINVLAAGSQLGATQIPQLTEALKVSGTVASNANLSFETTIAAIETLGEVELKGAEAGTALRNVIIRLQQQGIDAINPKVVGLTTAFRNLNELQLTDVELIKLFGAETLAAAQALSERTARTDELETAITGTNKAQEQAATQTDDLEGKFDLFDNALDALGITISTVVNPVIGGLIENLTLLIRETNAAAKSVIEFGNDVGNFFGDLLGTQDSIVRSVATGTVEQIKARIEEEKRILQELTNPEAIAEQSELLLKLEDLLAARTKGASDEGKPKADKPSTITDEERRAALAKLRAESDKKNETDKEAAKLAREAAKAAQEQAKALQDIQDRLNPIGEATRDYLTDLQVLNQALQEGTITEDQYVDANERLTETFERVRDPLINFNEELQRQLELSQLGTAQQEIESQVFDAVNQLKSEGVEVTNELTASIRSQFEAIRDNNEETERLESLLQQVKDTGEDYEQTQEDLNRLYKEGKITVEELADALDKLNDRQLQASTGLADGFERGLGRAQAQFEDFASTSERITVDAFNGMQKGLGDFVKTGKADFGSLKDFIIDSIIQIGTQAAISEIFFGNGSAGATTGSGGSGGLVGTVGKIAGAFFSSNSSTPALGDGGIQNSETLARIAEKGPEAVIPLKGGNVPVEISDQARPTLNVSNNFNITTPDVGGFNRSRREIEQMLGVSIQQAMQRNG